METTTAREVAVAAAADIPDGWAVAVHIGPRRLALVNLNGRIHALDGTCSHAGGPIGDARVAADGSIGCPWHDARFDACSGAAVCAPARKGLRTYPTAVRDGVVHVVLEQSP
jgi:naphthalene 1,2-dioxygenase system ferredoxin subunit